MDLGGERDQPCAAHMAEQPCAAHMASIASASAFGRAALLERPMVAVWRRHVLAIEPDRVRLGFADKKFETATATESKTVAVALFISASGVRD